MNEVAVEKYVTFNEARVKEWCHDVGDYNEIHLDPEAAAESSFGERVVPGMMLLAELSGMLTENGDEDDEVILAGVTAARFRDPVLFDEEVRFCVAEPEDSVQGFKTVDFEARVESRDSLVANGSLTVVIK